MDIAGELLKRGFGQKTLAVKRGGEAEKVQQRIREVSDCASARKGMDVVSVKRYRSINGVIADDSGGWITYRN